MRTAHPKSRARPTPSALLGELYWRHWNASESRHTKAPTKALLVDSWYDSYLGVVVLVRVKDGHLRRGQKIRMMAKGSTHTVEQLGYYDRVSHVSTGGGASLEGSCVNIILFCVDRIVI